MFKPGHTYVSTNIEENKFYWRENNKCALNKATERNVCYCGFVKVLNMHLITLEFVKSIMRRRNVDRVTED